jgi:hypothetical protein
MTRRERPFQVGDRIEIVMPTGYFTDRRGRIIRDWNRWKLSQFGTIERVGQMQAIIKLAHAHCGEAAVRSIDLYFLRLVESTESNRTSTAPSAPHPAR